MNLTHPFTPDSLAEINQQIHDCLALDPVEETHLKVLVEQRAELVDILLKTLQTSQLRQFASAEIKSNDNLIAHISSLRTSAKNALSGVKKSSRAIKQYQKCGYEK